ncbi:hypothetical protein JCM6294_2232 [Bacteroides pyogenes DSM 20611 = JCM 6294]|uniref:Uncharacterized protein n=1 Tax=Bacteroides pyogenes DSM 20611 = JCM 6294 TaxID=1121100 RepID=W4PHA7_9BACE|nr:hypothetical protein JCM6294_2232 [Bacteroides pyogenes DSM 20611 = JCM 6294]
MTTDQKEKVQSSDPSKLEADVTALSALLTKYGAIYDWAGRMNHFDFGFSSVCLMLDTSGMDMPSENTGYNWYNDELLMTDRTETGRVTYFMWNQFYSHIKKCNDILQIAPSNTESVLLKKISWTSTCQSCMGLFEFDTNLSVYIQGP